MGQFGQELRRERESRGIALETISGVTKISGRHLLALEDEKFDALPGGVLSKGIVRGYVRAVGLDEQDWVSRYLSASQPSGSLTDEDADWMAFAENVGRARKGNRYNSGQGMRWAGVVLLLTLLAAFGWYVTHFVNGRAALAAEDLHPPQVTAPAMPAAAIASSSPSARRHRPSAPAVMEPAQAAPANELATNRNAPPARQSALLGAPSSLPGEPSSSFAERNAQSTAASNRASSPNR